MDVHLFVFKDIGA